MFLEPVALGGLRLLLRRHVQLPPCHFTAVRRRTKVIGRFPGETSALSLIWAVLELSSRGWRGVAMTPRTVAGSSAFAASDPTDRTKRREVIAA